MDRPNAFAASVGPVAWIASAAAQPGGVVNGLINPFESWLAFLEAIEFIPYLLGGGSFGAFVTAYPSPETSAIVAGWIGIVGWVVLGIAFGRDGAKGPFIANILFVPVLSLLAVGYWGRGRDDLFRSESSSAESAE